MNPWWAAARPNSLVIEVSLIRRLSVLRVTANPARCSSPRGCSSMVGKARVCTLDEGHTSRAMPAERTRSATAPTPTTRPSRTVMSSTSRTPCPRRSAPQPRASAMLATPAASPAWMVRCRPAARAIRQAARWPEAGKPSSGPARSNATTPRAAYPAATAATSSESRSWRRASTIRKAAIPVARLPIASPARAASITRDGLSPRATCSMGAKRTSAYTAPSAARSSTASQATRSRASPSCMTATTWRKASRYAVSDRDSP